MDHDVRNLGGRVALAMVAIGSGLAGACGAHALVDALTRRCPTGFGGCGSGQASWFGLASILFAFVLCGAAGGIAFEAVRRWYASRIAIPRAVGRFRSRVT